MTSTEKKLLDLLLSVEVDDFIDSCRDIEAEDLWEIDDEGEDE